MLKDKFNECGKCLRKGFLGASVCFGLRSLSLLVVHLRGAAKFPSWFSLPLALTRGLMGLAIFLPVRILRLLVGFPLMCQTLLTCILTSASFFYGF